MLASPTPLGPILIVCELKMSVMGVAPGPMVKVLEPITTKLEPISLNVTPPAVNTLVGAGVAAGGAIVVLPPMPTPPGPILIVTELNTSVVGVAPEPIVNVLAPITTKLDPISENVMPPPVTTFVCCAGGGAIVVLPPTPILPGPILTVTPLTTAVVGVACVPSVKVLPPMTTRLELSSEKVMPTAVKTCVGFGALVPAPGFGVGRVIVVPGAMI